MRRSKIIPIHRNMGVTERMLGMGLMGSPPIPCLYRLYGRLIGSRADTNTDADADADVREFYS